MNEKIVFYVGNFDKPESNAAGKRVYGIALILAKLGYRIVLIGKSNTQHTNSYPIEYKENIVYYSFPKVNLIHTQAFIDYIVNIMEIEGKPSLIIRYGSPGLSLFDSKLMYFCRKKSIKLVADVVDWLSSSGNNLIFNCVKTIDTYLEKAIYNKKSDGVIAISSYLSNYYSERACKTIIIPPVVSDYHKNKGENNCIRIVYAGMPFRLGRKVNKSNEVKDRLDLAVRAVGFLDKSKINLILDIYGITAEQYLTAYPGHKNIIESNQDIICFHGNRPMHEVQCAVQNADFTILLRDRNRATMAGFPTKVTESLSLGTPVITTNTSDLDKYIKPGKTGFFVDITNEEQLIQQLFNICMIDRNELSDIKHSCYESRDFCVEKFKDILEDFIKRL